MLCSEKLQKKRNSGSKGLSVSLFYLDSYLLINFFFDFLNLRLFFHGTKNDFVFLYNNSLPRIVDFETIFPLPLPEDFLISANWE